MVFVEIKSKYPQAFNEMETKYTEKYLNSSPHIDEIKAECKGDDDLEKLLDKMTLSLYRYTEVVCQYHQIFFKKDDDWEDQLKNIEEVRERIHNVTIDSINVLSREMGKKEKNNSWIDDLVKGGRVAYGKFAIVNTFIDLMKEKEELHGKR